MNVIVAMFIIFWNKIRKNGELGFGRYSGMDFAWHDWNEVVGYCHGPLENEDNSHVELTKKTMRVTKWRVKGMMKLSVTGW